MVSTYMKSVLLCAIFLIKSCHGFEKLDTDTHLSNYIADLWLEGADVIKILWRDCSKKLVDVKDVIDHKEYFPKFIRCMKRKTLRALDRSLATDIVPLTEGVNLVRFEMVDKSGNLMNNDNETSFWTEQELEESEWRTLALQRMAKVLRTHVIKFDFDKNGVAAGQVEYRGRRRHQMMTMMMFGIVSIGMVLIPMGFQFLAVLGGKALLLAKMALILASIQGLKKIASSPLSYGFYHTYPPYDHIEKRSSDWPGSSMSVTSFPSLPSHNLRPSSENIKIEKRETNKVPESKPHGLSKEKPRLYPVYIPETSSPPFYGTIESPSPLTDLTTTPGEVQADYSIDFPYNGFRFQSSTPVVSA